MKFVFFLIIASTFLIGCKTINQKVDKASQNEQLKLSKFLQKSETELKIEFGKPDKIEKTDNRSTILIYYESKFKIRCERRFTINSLGVVTAFSSKNCF